MGDDPSTRTGRPTPRSAPAVRADAVRAGATADRPSDEWGHGPWTAGSADDAGGRTAPVRTRPQALMLSFCAVHLLHTGEAVSTGSVLEVLGRVGVGAHAARSTLARMARRGLLERHRRGQRVYVGLTPRAEAVLEAGGRRIEAGPIDRNWDRTWTLLGFSLPESRRGDRHLLRSRLAWAGFGMLQNGVWIAPSAVDTAELFEGLDVAGDVNVFRARTAPPTNPTRMVHQIWDLDALAAGYRRFLDRWDRADPLPDAPDDLARQLWLVTEWLLLVRQDPRLPLEYLPADWPALKAEHIHRRLREEYLDAAARIVAEATDRVRVEETPRRG